MMLPAGGGVALKVPGDQVVTVKAHLDYREKGGYSEHYMDIFNYGSSMPVVKDALVYVGTTMNSQYVGPAKSADIAYQIYSSVGPSGPNIDYLLNLCEALRSIAPSARDDHMFDLEKKVKALVAADAPKASDGKYSASDSILEILETNASAQSIEYRFINTTSGLPHNIDQTGVNLLINKCLSLRWN
ncbi:hypothetical protein K493DRAFT_335354 [Basidiobolus meristosporus CBS 931.73]|uniref:glutathione-specific gamma-glutamylcyclotransferase n=1 Tax=Basidiobolus meristosporus CBS 931.73 TaxID=1314790 RepID=A0A1Y1YR77_9FUNG|nr:hypothetical protein K493DRAFT_335354 [Basidiobolus meristosporus CBS 931.73]|eukprot:ORY00530.1 hypothetical protein K493DRAFT_335354 [Basidiobolus meristosporus CBS 931.73]